MSTNDEVLREADSLLRELSNDLVTLERSPDEETVAGLFRAAHTLKGNCAMAGIDGAATIAHAVEDFLAAVRSGDVDPTETLVDGALDAVDEIEAILDALGEGATPGVDPDATATALRDLIEAHETDNGGASADMGATESPGIDLELPEPDTDLSAEEALERVSVFDDLDRLMAGIDDDEAFAELSGAGTFDEIGENERSSSPDTPPRSERPDNKPAATDEPEETKDDDPFIWLGDVATEETDVDALQADLEEETFGEFDGEDEMSIQELIELDPTGETEDTAVETSSDEPEETKDGDPFIWLEDVAAQETDVDALQADLEEETFGEFDEEDEMGIQELIELDPTGETDDATDETPPDEPEGTEDTADETSPDESEGTPIDEPEDTPTDDDSFIQLKDVATQETDVDALQADLEDVTFGEFDEEDEMGIQELIELDPTRETDTAKPSEEETVLDGSVDIDLAVTDDRGESGAEIEPLEEEEILDTMEAIDLSQTESASESDDIEFEREAGTKAFAERFGDLFNVESDSKSTRSVGTIEESSLDLDRFRRETPVEIDPAGASIHSINVDVGMADDLLNLVEELSMSRLAFEDALDEIDAERAEVALSALRSIEAQFRRSVMELRLMSLSSAVEGLPRVVRDIARDQGKRISFDVDVEDVKLDRSVAERIGEPLVHLVRNAADHGIESPEEREAAGKPPEGQIELRAERVRDGAVIEIEDDGRGIDPDAVLTKGIEEEVITRAEAETMGEKDAYELLFHHGLTTCDEVTNVSGRGVGMDIVDRVCSDLDGSVEIESEPGEGTIVRLRLPVTVAMAKLLFIETSGERYAIPMSDIRYIGGPARESESDDRTFIPEPSPDWDETDDEADQYRLVRLHEAFDVPAPSTGEGVIVWLRPEIERVAIHCGDIVESREAVVKPYGPPLDGVPGISGAAMGENGEVINIIDVTTIA